ncbi:MAG: YbaB/EbfC family nucleoid-associated protein [Anaerolineae bacterium]|nr:YbaB/EbfC family nucleoid-associated protein [Anaerolineae bacterium]
MMKQIEQLQSQMEQAQASLEEQVITASVGGGVVTIEMTGAQELRSIKIKPEVLDPDDVEILEDLLMAAFKEAMQKAQQLAADKMGPLAGGLDIPGLF